MATTTGVASATRLIAARLNDSVLRWSVCQSARPPSVTGADYAMLPAGHLLSVHLTGAARPIDWMEAAIEPTNEHSPTLMCMQARAFVVTVVYRSDLPRLGHCDELSGPEVGPSGAGGI